MRIGIFYASLKPGPGRKLFVLSDGSRVYVSIDVLVDSNLDLIGALDHAFKVKAEDETVLNTVDLESKE